jgi:hypothetical protein
MMEGKLAQLEADLPSFIHTRVKKSETNIKTKLSMVKTAVLHLETSTIQQIDICTGAT